MINGISILVIRELKWLTLSVKIRSGLNSSIIFWIFFGVVIHLRYFFPNFEFIRALQKSLDSNEGSIFRYATHENTIVSEQVIPIEDVSTQKNTYDLEEIQLNISDDEPIQLKKPNEVYYEIYRVARNKARQAKQAAIIAYLEAKNIKQTYMLDGDSDSDDSLEDLEQLSEE